MLNAIRERFCRFTPALTNPAWRGVSLNPRVRPLLLNGVLRLATFLGKELLGNRTKPESGGASIFVFVGSQNNLASAQDAFGKRSDTKIWTFHNLKKEGLPHLSLFWQYLTGLWVLFLFPLFLFTERRPYVRRAMCAHLDEFVLSMGSIKSVRSFLKNAQPRLVVVMSTLSSYQNVIVEAANELRIPTLFMTHAPVGRGQIPLPTTHAFIDGTFQEQLFAVGTTKMTVTGSPRGMRLRELAMDRSDKPGLIIATNTLIESLDEIDAALNKLRSMYGSRLPLALRPHPADSVRFARHRAIAAKYGAVYHDPQYVLSDGLEDFRFLAAPQSGILIDGLLLGFWPLVIKAISPQPKCEDVLDDYYGLKELELVGELDLQRPYISQIHVSQKNLAFLDKAADPDWNVEAAINAGIKDILREANTL